MKTIKFNNTDFTFYNILHRQKFLQNLLEHGTDKGKITDIVKIKKLKTELNKLKIIVKNWSK